MTTKHEIEIPDLPEGWRAVAFREPRLGEHYLSDINTVIRSNFNNCGESNLIVEKIKPRRIVLEETDEVREVAFGEYFFSTANLKVSSWPWPGQSTEKYKIWRVVEGE